MSKPKDKIVKKLGDVIFAQCGTRTQTFANLKSLEILQGNKGAALMMAIFTMTMLLSVSMDMLFETSVEMQVSSQKVNQVKAYYAAKSGVEISLLRIHIYKKAIAMAGSMLPNKSMLDPIWQTPFAWPPVLPGATSRVDKDEVKNIVKESLMKSQYLATIDSEGSKIDINDLASKSKPIADAARTELNQILNSRIETDEAFSSRYRGFDFNRVLNNIADWIDDNKDSRNGGDKTALYPQRGTNQFIPPNQHFKTLQELHMVEGMNDELFELLEPRITIYGTSGINVNYASKEVIQSLSPLITAEKAKLIVDARSDPKRGPFKDQQDLLDYFKTIGLPDDIFKSKDSSDPKATAVLLLFDPEYNFRVHSTGISGKVTKDIVAIVYDLDQAKARMKTTIDASKAQANPKVDPATGQPIVDDPSKPKTAAKPDATKAPAPERPNIVYWNET